MVEIQLVYNTYLLKKKINKQKNPVAIPFLHYFLAYASTYSLHTSLGRKIEWNGPKDLNDQPLKTIATQGSQDK